jgi:ElaB/YqjD/DUF883 family membrane-anchored ribosome-binding protein
MNAFPLIRDHSLCFTGFIMDAKPNSSLPSSKTSLNSPKEAGSLATAASPEVRKDVERAIGNLAGGAKETKDQAEDKAQEIKGEFIDAAGDAKETVSRVADKAKQYSSKAIEATSTYATYAVDAAGQKVRQAQSKITSAKSTASDYIHEDPVRAVTYTAIGTAVLTAALIGIFRRR